MVNQRVVRIWIVYLVLLFGFTLCYFVLAPIWGIFVDLLSEAAVFLGLSGSGLSSFSFILSIFGQGWIWIPILFFLFLLLWAIRASTKKEGEGYYRGYV